MEYLQTLPGAINLGLIWALLAIGVFITFRILNIADLTVDGSFATGGAVAAIFIAGGGPFPVALLLGFLAGLLCGLVTGLLHTLLNIPAILAGILTQLSLWSINLVIMNSKANQSISARYFQTIFSQLNVGDAMWKMAIIIALFIGLLYLFFGTELGSAIRATGNNENMARAQGINTKLNKVIGLALSNGLVALAGALLAQYQGFADINMGRGAIVIGLCAIVIGEALLHKINRNFAVRLCGVVLGAIIYYIVFQTVIYLGLPTDMLKILSAVVVAIFLGFPYVRKQIAEYLNRRHAEKTRLQAYRKAGEDK